MLHGHLHQMVPAAGPVKRKRKAEHQRHNAVCKKAIPPRRELDAYFGRACSLQAPDVTSDGKVVAASRGYRIPQHAGLNVSNFGPGKICFSGEEGTDDESEFSSSDGRTSPFHLVSWGAGGVQDVLGFEAAAGCHPAMPAFATANRRGTAQTPTTTTAVPTGFTAVAVGDGGAAANEYVMANTQYDQHQGNGRWQVRDGGRPDADEWGWFVDAGEDQPSRGNVQQQQQQYGCYRGAQD